MAPKKSFKLSNLFLTEKKKIKNDLRIQRGLFENLKEDFKIKKVDKMVQEIAEERMKKNKKARKATSKNIGAVHYNYLERERESMINLFKLIGIDITKTDIDKKFKVDLTKYCITKDNKVMAKNDITSLIYPFSDEDVVIKFLCDYYKDDEVVIKEERKETELEEKNRVYQELKQEYEEKSFNCGVYSLERPEKGVYKIVKRTARYSEHIREQMEQDFKKYGINSDLINVNNVEIKKLNKEDIRNKKYLSIQEFVDKGIRDMVLITIRNRKEEELKRKKLINNSKQKSSRYC